MVAVVSFTNDVPLVVVVLLAIVVFLNIVVVAESMSNCSLLVLSVVVRIPCRIKEHMRRTIRTTNRDKIRIPKHEHSPLGSNSRCSSCPSRVPPTLLLPTFKSNAEVTQRNE